MIRVQTQYELIQQLKRRTRDTSDNRWSAVEKYDAINYAILSWGKRVLVPYVYTISGGWVSSTRQYTLPDYIHPPIDPQIKRGSNDYWELLTSYELSTDTGTGTLLTLAFYPSSDTARVIWWDVNSTVPTTVATVSTTISSSDTTLITSATDLVADNGFIKIDNEWIQYSGKTIGTSTTTLNNLVRACFDTTAASHTSSTSIYWGVGAHRDDLYVQLLDQATAHLHSLLITDGAAHEMEAHQFNMRYYQQRADEFWRRYAPLRSPKMVLSRQAIGDTRGHTDFRYPLSFGDYYPY